MKLTDRQKASGLTPTDIVHIVLTNDSTQDPHGSSYKAEIQQFIDIMPKYPIITGGTYTGGTTTLINNTGGTITITGYSNINWYSENITKPTIKPIATGLGSIALGNNAQALSNNMFVYGMSSGYQASGANNSNFVGYSAGYQATNASYSNLFGSYAGDRATNASYSNLFGYGSGVGATNANNSNFMGYYAGQNATNASYSNFMGSNAGFRATGASYSTFIGFNVGYVPFSSNSLGSNNIIIGTNISLSAGTTDSINIGGVLFGSGTYSNTTGNPSVLAQTAGRIGINVVTPTTALHVYSDTADISGLRLERLTSSSPISMGQAIGVDASGNVVTVATGTGSTYSSYWTSGSTGTYSIKVINDSSVDATGPYAIASGYNTLASGYGSFAGGTGTTASGEVSFASGYDTIASGDASFAMGEAVTSTNYGTASFGSSINNNSAYGFISGVNLKADGYTSTLFGIGHEITGLTTTVVGQAANIINNDTSDHNSFPLKEMFVVGNGTIQNADQNYTVLTRSDAFIVRYNGVATLPSITNSLINAEVTGKAVITREYLESTQNLQKIITSSYTATSADNNYTIIINNTTTPISITIPTSLLDKINVGFIQQGTADVSFVAGGGVTINSPSSMLKIKGQNYNAYFEQVGSTNVYQLLGNLKT